ncbi:E3 ubiquitin-protein ligase TRIM39-like [Rhinatrema bivittatum]|uniref:E3 ubiquitin-protein ligase TRIM39-like n=1 Tax=Rhinatrema bivittatum TaxID=194408 RepID=UPI001125EA41|nr:E3 ubiquitin-protein ligase TRIM39-like [Rhinatrema bivittatum]
MLSHMYSVCGNSVLKDNNEIQMKDVYCSQNKIQTHLERVRKELEDLLKLKSSEERKAEELRSQTEIKRRRVESDFEEIQRFLTEGKRILLSRLEEEEKKILQRIRENVTRLEEQSSSIKLLISEIEEKSQQPAAELLKDVKETLTRCQNAEFPKPEAVSTDLRLDFPLRYPQQLKKVITCFGGRRISLFYFCFICLH